VLRGQPDLGQKLGHPLPALAGRQSAGRPQPFGHGPAHRQARVERRV